MKLDELAPAQDKKTRTRVGRGMGSGLGKTSGRGHKGQKARSGGGVRRGFEGGQTPLYRRLPKRGFTNIHALNYTEVTLTMLNKATTAEVTAESLIADGIISKANDGIVCTDDFRSEEYYGGMDSIVHRIHPCRYYLNKAQ